MKPGPKPTTLRGRKAGGKEIRAWVSAEEFARVQAAKGTASLDSFVREAVLAAADVVLSNLGAPT